MDARMIIYTTNFSFLFSPTFFFFLLWPPSCTCISLSSFSSLSFSSSVLYLYPSSRSQSMCRGLGGSAGPVIAYLPVLDEKTRRSRRGRSAWKRGVGRGLRVRPRCWTGSLALLREMERRPTRWCTKPARIRRAVAVVARSAVRNGSMRACSLGGPG